MENNYKRLADVDVVEAVEDSAHVLVEVDGEIKKTAKSNVGGGSGGGGVTSWNDLEDKPFGEEYVQIAEKTLENTKNNSFSFEDSLRLYKMIAGDTYVVVINDDKYEVVCKSISVYDPMMGETSTVYSLGNMAVYDNTDENTGEPFYIVYNNAYGCYEIYFEESGTYTVRVLENSIKPIDPKYLPKAAAVDDVTDAPTAEDFNTLLAALREAGYLTT